VTAEGPEDGAGIPFISRLAEDLENDRDIAAISEGQK
jgi:hypothetical protein